MELDEDDMCGWAQDEEDQTLRLRSYGSLKSLGVLVPNRANEKLFGRAKTAISIDSSSCQQVPPTAEHRKDLVSALRAKTESDIERTRAVAGHGLSLGSSSSARVQAPESLTPTGLRCTD